MRLAESSDKDHAENLIPLINVVFLLLIFFMIAGAITHQDIFHVEPPESGHARILDEHGVTVLLARDGRLAIGDTPVDAEALRRRLDEAAREAGDVPPAVPVRVKADQAASAADLLDLLDLLRAAGVGQVHLLAVTAE